MGCTRVLPKSRVANPAVLGPAKSDLATKTNPEGHCIYYTQVLLTENRVFSFT
jgi:hypothetical protein